MMYLMSDQHRFLHLGNPMTLTMTKLLHWIDWLGASDRVLAFLSPRIVNWDNQVGKMGSYELLKLLSSHKEYSELRHVLEGTWRSAGGIGMMLCALFFARYPHRNGILLEN